MYDWSSKIPNYTNNISYFAESLQNERARSTCLLIRDYIIQLMPVPLEHAVRTDEWQDDASELNHIVPSSETYKNGLFLAKLLISKMTIKQLLHSFTWNASIFRLQRNIRH